LLFGVALALRLAAVAALDSPRLAQSGRAWDFGAEAACLADSFLRGAGYGDPWAQGTGPSSWLTPPYPALVALCFELFGGVNRAAAWALFTLQSAASAATAVVLARLGARLGSPRAGLVAGWCWAVYPLAVWNAAHVVWDTTFVALGVALFAWQLLSLRRDSGARGELALGAGLGALAFLNPSPLALLPGVIAYLLLRERASGPWFRAPLLLCLGVLAVVLPWMVRNQRVLGSAVLRPNFGVELRIGNHAEATGHPVPFRYHPSHVSEELSLYRQLGEVAYAEENAARAWSWISAHPGSFALLSLQRTFYYWIGDWPLADTRRGELGQVEPAGDWNSWVKWLCFLAVGVLGLWGLARWSLPAPERAFLALGLPAFSLPYAITHVSERYRFPIDPLLLLLAVGWLLRSRERRTK
jgi:4-amino-4-deoxy-L-arabinose transferase-like glycosyltransferase